jgi:hypothetical protein
VAIQFLPSGAKRRYQHRWRGVLGDNRRHSIRPIPFILLRARMKIPVTGAAGFLERFRSAIRFAGGT